jgi:hypothetical protein
VREIPEEVNAAMSGESMDIRRMRTALAEYQAACWAYGHPDGKTTSAVDADSARLTVARRNYLAARGIPPV